MAVLASGGLAPPSSTPSRGESRRDSIVSISAPDESTGSLLNAAREGDLADGPPGPGGHPGLGHLDRLHDRRRKRNHEVGASRSGDACSEADDGGGAERGGGAAWGRAAEGAGGAGGAGAPPLGGGGVVRGGRWARGAPAGRGGPGGRAAPRAPAGRAEPGAPLTPAVPVMPAAPP